LVGYEPVDKFFQMLLLTISIMHHLAD